jgi:hypothetical protein
LGGGFFFVVWALWEYLLDIGFLRPLGIVYAEVLVGFLLWASWVFLCMLPVYLGALFAFLIKFDYLAKKKKEKKEALFYR